MKDRTLINVSLVALACLSVAVVVIAASGIKFHERLTCPQRVFELQKVPPFLTDEIALAKARETLTLEGLEISKWDPHEDGRTRDPENRPDKYLARNGINPNRGVIMFVNKANYRACAVSVELEGDKVICQLTFAK